MIEDDEVELWAELKESPTPPEKPVVDMEDVLTRLDSICTALNMQIDLEGPRSRYLKTYREFLEYREDELYTRLTKAIYGFTNDIQNAEMTLRDASAKKELYETQRARLKRKAPVNG